MSPTINITNGTFNGTITYEDTTTPPTQPPPETHGKITNFSASSGSQFQIDGVDVDTQNASKAWSLKNPDPYTLQFEVRSGDRYQHDSAGSERNEIQFSPHYAEGVQTGIEATLTIQPGPLNTAGWVDFIQLHATTNVSPTYSPFVLALDHSDKLEIVLQEPAQGNLYVYKTPNPVARGQAIAVKCEVTMQPAGGGRVKVWFAGVQVVDYTGPVGATNSEYYWKCGIYRGAARETLAATFRNIHAG
jgi:hypothetical protein